MKISKLFVVGSILLLSSTLASAQKQKPVVVASASIFKDMTEQIAQDLVSIKTMVPIGADPHLYEPTPSDVQLINNADLILINGMTFEGWIEKLISNSGTSAPIITITKGIRAIESTEYENSVDPHAWMTASNGVIYAENIKNALVKLDPEHRDIYETRCIAYQQKLEKLDIEIAQSIAEIPTEKRILITSHDAFAYYGQRYNIRLEPLVGISTDAEIKVADINRVTSIIRKNQIPAIFVESTINPKLLKQIATDNGCVIGSELFADSLDDPGTAAGTYHGMLWNNTRNIVNALKSEVYSYQSLEIENSIWNDLILYGILALLLIGGIVIMFVKNKSIADSKDRFSGVKPIIIKGLSVSYDKKRVLTNINLELKSNSIYGVIGPNGAGKSTLFKAILGLLDINAGNISIYDQEISKHFKKVAYVPQRDDIDWSFPATVLDVVMQGRYPHKHILEPLNTNDLSITEKAMIDLDILDLKDIQIGQLSGGQQQRVFLARALAQEAEIILLDEPFVGVDILTEQKIITILKKLRDENKTLLVVHHDLSTVEHYFDHVILLNQRLIACGKTEKVFNKENIAKTYSSQLTILHKTGLLKK